MSSPKSLPIFPWPLGTYHARKGQGLVGRLLNTEVFFIEDGNRVGSILNKRQGRGPVDRLLNKDVFFIEDGGHVGSMLRELGAPSFLPSKAMQLASFHTWSHASLEGQPDLSSQPIEIHGVREEPTSTWKRIFLLP